MSSSLLLLLIFLLCLLLILLRIYESEWSRMHRYSGVMEMHENIHSHNIQTVWKRQSIRNHTRMFCCCCYWSGWCCCWRLRSFFHFMSKSTSYINMKRHWHWHQHWQRGRKRWDGDRENKHDKCSYTTNIWFQFIWIHPPDVDIDEHQKCIK